MQARKTSEISKRYAKHLANFERKSLPRILEDIKEDGRKQALLAVLENTVLPRVVASLGLNSYFFPHFLGVLGKSYLFFHKNTHDEHLLMTSPATKSVPLCSLFREPMTSKLSGNIIKAVDKTHSSLFSGLPITEIPPGFFVFQYQAQWAAGGHYGEQKTVFTVRKADSLDKATQDLIRLALGSQRENCFWDFFVNSGDGWRRLYAKPNDKLFSRLNLLESTLSLVP